MTSQGARDTDYWEQTSIISLQHQVRPSAVTLFLSLRACVTYDGTVGLRVDAAEPFQLHHGFGLLPLLTAALQVAVKEIHHLRREEEAGRGNEGGGGGSNRETGGGTGTCLRHQASPRVILWMAICRLFISPSSSGADRLSELKLLSSRARKRFSSWRPRHTRGGNVSPDEARNHLRTSARCSQHHPEKKAAHAKLSTRRG